MLTNFGIGTLGRNALAVLAFAAYAAATLALDQAGTSSWAVEKDDGFQAGISFSVYGAPLGTVVDNVSNAFHELYNPASHASVPDIFANTAGGQTPGHPQQRFDGTGAGYPLFASLAMWIFGPQVPAVIYAFLALVGLSSFAYAARFQDDRLLVVPLYYFALTTMMLSPMAADTYMAGQIPIGGNRYFMLAAVVPAFHLFFEFADRDRASARETILLGFQAAVLVFVIFVRSSIAYLLLPVGFVWLRLLWRGRRRRRPQLPVLWKAAAAAGAGALVIAAVAAAMPAYMQAGRALGIFWHRAVISLGAHPQFPFGDMAEKVDCRNNYPPGLEPGIRDAIGWCFWLAEPANTDQDIGRLNAGYLTPGYERVARAGLLRTIAAYPRQAVELYAYYKPRLIVRNLMNGLTLTVTVANARAAWLICLQWLLFAAFALLTSASGLTAVGWRLGSVLVVDFLLSMAPGIVAWSNAATGADTIFFMYCLIGFAAAAALGLLVRLMRQDFAPAPAPIEADRPHGR